MSIDQAYRIITDWLSGERRYDYLTMIACLMFGYAAPQVEQESK